MLFEMMGRQFKRSGRDKAAESHFKRARFARDRARALHDVVLKQEDKQDDLELPPDDGVQRVS